MGGSALKLLRTLGRNVVTLTSQDPTPNWKSNFWDQKGLELNDGKIIPYFNGQVLKLRKRFAELSSRLHGRL